MFNPSAGTYTARIASRIDFMITSIAFDFINSGGQVFNVKFESTEGGKSKAIGLKYGDELYMV